MYSFSALCCFLGFYCLYNTSKKATLHQNYKILIWLQKNTKPARFLGITLIILSFIGLITTDGREAGTFSAVVLLMAMASLVVVISPFRLIKWHHLLAILFFLIVSELLIFC